MKVVKKIKAVVENFSTASLALIRWGYQDQGQPPMHRSTLYVGPDGTLNLQPEQEGTGARLILYPLSMTPAQTRKFLLAHARLKTKDNTGPDVGAQAEVTIYGMTDQSADNPEENFERFSMTQMNKNERNVRFSMERGGTGEFREIWFGYDTFTAGKAYFPLRICPGAPGRKKGVYVVDDDDNYTWIGG